MAIVNILLPKYFAGSSSIIADYTISYAKTHWPAGGEVIIQLAKKRWLFLFRLTD